MKDATAAAALNPHLADAWSDLGIAYHQSGATAQARAAYAKALVLSPSMAQVVNNLGVLTKAEGNWGEALRHFTSAAISDPSNAAFLTHRAAALCALGRGFEAAGILPKLKVLAADRTLAISATVCQSLMNTGRYLDALPLATQLLDVNLHDQAAQTLFVSCARRIEWGRFDSGIHSTLAQALVTPWCAPSMLSASAASMVKTHPLLREFLGRRPAAPDAPLLQHLAQDKLFAALLRAGPNTDPELEMVLTVLRRYLLARAGDGQEFRVYELDLLALIATQAFINEFVFWESDEEAVAVADLKARIEGEISNGRSVEAAHLLILASYLELSQIAGAESLAAMTWPDAVHSVIRQQITEPTEERILAEHIEALTPIENEISRMVRAQYEKNPYPRWVTPVPVGAVMSIEHYVRAKFPHAPLRPSPGGESPEILIAGCGTGQHSLMTATLYLGARVLAVDLSRQSLGYAARKSLEAGVDVTYAQADLLRMPALGRHFDAIESVGVLHHMADPLAGWKALVSMLRPGGFMVLGFYSDIARGTLPSAVTLGAGTLSDVSRADIRRARRTLLAGPDKQIGSPLRMGDFYATSSCRDLLFHVQEHRMSLPQIADFLAGNNLTFLGFNLAADRLHAYRTQYPEDAACRDLSNWEDFEKQHPSTFLDMYQFWVQKAE